MKTKRKLFINNSLVHGICNCNCMLCAVNKKSYSGPKCFQEEKITKKIIFRIKEAAKEGIIIDYVGNSGQGEPTLHPDFIKRMQLFGDMIKNWDIKNVDAPEISVVTNGINLTKPGILNAIIKNNITLLISFPTSHEKHYGEIMVSNSSLGKNILSKVIPGIEKAIVAAASGKLKKLKFHISPPYRKYIRPDFPQTLNFLLNLACKNNLKELELIMFPATSNRTGLIYNYFKKVDYYKDYFRKYNNKIIKGVKIKLKHVHKRVYPHLKDILDVLIHFDYPCITYGNIHLTGNGDSGCCHDQNAIDISGNIMTNSINELMILKEKHMPSEVCKICNQSPFKLNRTLFLFIYNTLVRLKTLYISIINKQ